jgi:cytochrome c-type biogenesis protein CcmE
MVSKKSARVAVSAVVLLGALGLLLSMTITEGAQFYKHVDEVMTSPEQWYGKPMQLHGFVVEDSVEQVPDTLIRRFKIKNNDAVVMAMYTGVVPDTFKGGSEVVLKGKLGPAGFQVEKDGVMAKCPSKYNPKDGAKR